MENELKQKLGLIHIYCGDGKGKTTASMGLALRAIGNGLRVIIVQFLKDGTSGEISVLQKLGAKVIVNQGKSKFSFNMNDDEKSVCRQMHHDNLKQAISLCENGECDLLILDEALGAISTSLLDEQQIEDFIREKPSGIELVITGRNPSHRLIELANYVSEIRKVKHPFDMGIHARDGIEK